MSSPTTIQANTVPFALSTNDTTYKNIVCKKTWNWNMDATTAQEETDCGVLTGVGAIKISFDFEFVLNTTPNGASEWSSDEILTLFLANTLAYVKTTNGSTYFRKISGYFTSYKESAPQGGFITATGTFTGTGTLSTS